MIFTLVGLLAYYEQWSSPLPHYLLIDAFHGSRHASCSSYLRPDSTTMTTGMGLTSFAPTTYLDPYGGCGGGGGGGSGGVAAAKPNVLSPVTMPVASWTNTCHHVLLIVCRRFRGVLLPCDVRYSVKDTTRMASP